MAAAPKDLRILRHGVGPHATTSTEPRDPRTNGDEEEPYGLVVLKPSFPGIFTVGRVVSHAVQSAIWDDEADLRCDRRSTHGQVNGTLPVCDRHSPPGLRLTANCVLPAFRRTEFHDLSHNLIPQLLPTQPVPFVP